MIREDTPLADSVTYTFALGFKITATAKGITFAGSSTLFNAEQMVGVLRTIKKAQRVSEQLALGRGLPPEEELNKALVLRGATARDKTATAWYHGKEERVRRSTLAEAVSRLREMYRETQ